MSEWKASIGRVVLLPAVPMSSSPLSALDLYRRVWGREPDNFRRQPNPLAPSVAQGKRGGVTAGCLVHPTRIDFSLTPPPETTQLSLPLIEDTGQLHSELVKIIDVIGQDAVSISVVRVALNVQFLALKPSPVEANKALTAIIPSQYGVRITNEEDFIFQINRPYTSREVESIKMNSLTKWSVDRVQVLTMAIPMGGVRAPATRASVKPQIEVLIAASVNFDINNMQTETPLSGRQQSSLLREALTAAVQMEQDIGLNVEGFHNV